MSRRHREAAKDALETPFPPERPARRGPSGRPVTGGGAGRGVCVWG